ncbi:MAG TPA: cytochrome c maturation protein CcmE [Anaerolineae bacterium]|nr:cytochrome c maturation protein CcmE [Anaerolineae bacterium]
MKNRSKFVAGILLIIAAVVYLIATSTKASAQYFLTVDELLQRREEMTDKNVRISGAVIGDTIQYDAQKLELRFTIAHVPGDFDAVEKEGGLAAALHEAVTDPNRPRLEVVYYGPKPDLLRDEAQAILTGHLEADGVFYADELLLKCPSHYEEALPDQSNK